MPEEEKTSIRIDACEIQQDIVFGFLYMSFYKEHTIVSTKHSD